MQDDYSNNQFNSNKPQKNESKKALDKKFVSHKVRINLVKAALVICALLFFVAPMSKNIPQSDMFSMVTILGLDSSSNGLQASAEVIFPVENNGATGTTLVLSGQGFTLSAALENLCISIGRNLDLSHCALIVIGKDLAQQGIMDELCFLLSSGNVSPQISVVVSGNNDAKEFVQLINEYDQKLDVDNLLKYTSYGSHNYSQSLINFIKQTYSKSNSSVMPVITMGEKALNQSAVEGRDINDESQAQNDDKNQQDYKQDNMASDNKQNQAGDEGQEQQKNQTVIERTEKIAAFSQGKLKAVWSASQSNGLAWSDPKTKFGHITLYDLKYNDKSIDKLSCYLIKKKVKIQPSIKDKKPQLTFKINANFLLEERFKLYQVMDSQNAAETKKIYPIITEQLENKISEYILSAFESSKTDNCDVFLINDLFYKHYKKRYKWINKDDSLLNKCNIEFDFDIKIN